MYKSLLSLSNSWKRSKAFLIVNITGLAIGLTVSILLLMYVMNEWSYDRHFTNKDRIVQLNAATTVEGNHYIEPLCIRSAYTDLPQNIPGIEKAVQLYRGSEVEVIRKPERFQNLKLLYSDPEFFDFFEMKFVYGTAANALINPYSAVLTRPRAEAIFGKANPVGQTFTVEGSEFTVTAVVEKLPANTHFSFDVLASMKSVSYLKDMGGQEFFTYYLINPGMSKEQVCGSIKKSYSASLATRFSGFKASFDAITLPLTRIHLFSKAGYGLSEPGSLQSVLLLVGLALLILILAITNFVNLFIVQGNNRMTEVGIRKTNGAGIWEVSKQFFGEASAVVLISFVIGISAAIILRPSFSLLINKNIEPSLFYNPVFVGGAVLLILFTITLSASYPAFYLSRFKPVDILRKSASDRSKNRFTSSIVVFQSVITIVLIATMLIVNKQTNYLKSIPAGFNAQNVLIVGKPGDQITNHYDALKQGLQNIPGVKMVSSAEGNLVGGATSGEGIYRYDDNSRSQKSIRGCRVFSQFSDVMEFNLKEGNFFKENDSRNDKYVVLNEEAVKMLGFQHPVGEKVVMDKPMEVIGVVKNFIFESPAEQVAPIAFVYSKNPRYIYIRFEPSVNKMKAISLILPVFRKYDPDFVLNSTWSDDIYDGKFSREKNVARIIFTSTLLSLIIALLGLFAVHSFAIARRIKEIGIRKISGSTTWSIIVLLSGKVLLRSGISAVISLPLAWIIGRHWLETYSNRIQIGLLLLLIPLIIHTLIALLATFLVSYKAATRNPVEALRYE